MNGIAESLQVQEEIMDKLDKDVQSISQKNDSENAQQSL